MSRDGYLVDPHEGIKKSWWSNVFEVLFVVPTTLLVVAAVYSWILILPRRIEG